MSHQRNLLESIVGCCRERFTDKQAMRPDLSLHGVADDIRTVIEVVDQNPPSSDKQLYYRMQLMTLIVIRVPSNGSELLRNGVLHAEVAKYQCVRAAA